MALVYRSRRELSFTEEIRLYYALKIPVGSLGKDGGFWFYVLETDRKLNLVEARTMREMKLEPYDVNS